MADAPSSAAAAASGDVAEAQDKKKIDPKKAAKAEKFAAKQAKLEATKKDATPSPSPAPSATPSADASSSSTNIPGEAASADASSTSLKKKADKVVKEAVEEDLSDPTVKGERKDVSRPLPTSYQPKYVESSWYEWWEKTGLFKPEFGGDVSKREKFVIAIPPPNVTGSLHLGHALMLSIEDCMTRWNRMMGRAALYNPGCDHAGIATQVVVEKLIKAETGQTRHDLGREKFMERAWEWKHKYGDRIYQQIRKMGTSVDWDRAAFTMDEPRSKAVVEAFVRLHENGTIYRSTRLVNWCSKLKTAISNIEVDYKELEGRTLLTVPSHKPNKKYEFGALISFAYKVDGSDEEIVVATTRVETMLGDTAIAVHPNDERYKHLHGKFVVHPFVARKLPIIADTMVDINFGTGAVKLTPAHDANDYAAGQRHNLPFINILTDDGAINENGGKFAGLMRYDAREAVLAELTTLGLYRETKDNPMSIPLCSRSGDVIEPVIKPQWYVNCQQIGRAAMQAVQSGELRLIPSDPFDKVWSHWLETPQDWCISRQLWWGHRIPVYFVNIEGDKNDHNDNTRWVSGRTVEEARERAHAKFPDVKPATITLIQDEDVLDTWFSSALFPFSIMGWPDKTPDLENFYPNTILETGHDILFFWVARMVMMGIALTGKLPFKEVFLHSIVRDAHGRKMSKSLGNVIDPLDVINGISLKDLQAQIDGNNNLDPKEKEKAKKGQASDFPTGIAECGTDALRFTLLAYTSQARDINLDVKRVEGYRAFCNKIWNAVKFSRIHLGDTYAPTDASGLTATTLGERWILSRLAAAIKASNDGFVQYSYSSVTTAIYNFWLYELCDVYLEIIKPIMAGTEEDRKTQARDVLYTCIETGLRLLHPFMPFLTEELWMRLPHRPAETAISISVARYPTAPETWPDAKSEEEFTFVFATIKAIRSLRSEYLQPKVEGTVYVRVKAPALGELLLSQSEGIRALCRLQHLSYFGKDDEIPLGCVVNTVDESCEVFLLAKGLVDVTEEIQKLDKALEKVQKAIDALNAQMAIPEYQAKTPEKVRLLNDQKMSALLAEAEATTKTRANFERLK